MLLQPGLRRTCSETTLLVFPRGDSFYTKMQCKVTYNLFWHFGTGTKIAGRRLSWLCTATNPENSIFAGHRCGIVNTLRRPCYLFQSTMFEAFSFVIGYFCIWKTGIYMLYIFLRDFLQLFTVPIYNGFLSRAAS